MRPVMMLTITTVVILIAAASCQATGGRRGFFGLGGRKKHPPQEDVGGHNPSDTFGHVDLPLLDDATTGHPFGQMGLPDPGMYGGHVSHPANPQQHNIAYDMPPGGFQQADYSMYPSDMFQQQQEMYVQQQQDFQEYPFQPAPPPLTTEKKRRPSSKVLQRQRPQEQYALPPSEPTYGDVQSRKQKSQRWVGIEQQEDDARVTDDMARMTAAMRIGGLAPIQTSGRHQEGDYAGRQMTSGSMTSRVRRSKGKAPADARLPQEPQTAHLGARTSGSEYIVLDNDDDGEFEQLYGEEATIGNYRSGNAEEHALRVAVRNILKDEWVKRGLSFFRYSAEQMAAHFAEIKIVHPGYEQGIAYQASNMVARATLGTRDKYLQDFKDSTTTYTKRINYIRSRFVRNNPGLTTWDMPIEQVLHDFHRTLEKDRKEREKQKQAEKISSQKGQQDDEDDLPFTPQQAETAEMLWNDFMGQLILPAMNAGWTYNMSLVGTLLPRYSHDDFTPEQTQYFLIKYLHDVQDASESDLAELYQAATSGSGGQ